MSGAKKRGSPSDLPPAGSPEPSLAPTVDRLRDEVEGLRHALRSRAIIEQAKGMLMERYGCTPDEAFERLARLSQHANVKLADVASALVEASVTTAEPPRGRGRSRDGTGPGAPAHPVPDPGVPGARWPRQVSGDSEFGSRIRDLARGPRTRAELLAAVDPQDVLAAVVRTGLSHRPPSAAVLAALDVNGVVTVLASRGIPASAAARWRAFPLDLDLPVCVALRTGRPCWLVRRSAPAGGALAPGDRGEPPEGGDGDQDRGGGGLPGGVLGPSPALGLGLPEDWSLVAVIPLRSGRSGALVLVWPPGTALDPADREEVERLAVAAAAALVRLPRPASGRPDPRPPSGSAPDPTLAVLDTLWHPVLVCEPVSRPDGAVVDFLVVHANPAAGSLAPPAGRLVGRRLLEVGPDAVDNGLFDACLRVVGTGAQVDLPELTWRLAAQGGTDRGMITVRVTRYRGGVLITWVRTSPVTVDGPEAGELA